MKTFEEYLQESSSRDGYFGVLPHQVKYRYLMLFNAY